jgi:putative transposase
VVQTDEGRIQALRDGVVQSTVEEALNALLDAEATNCAEPASTRAPKGHKDTRAGSYDRQKCVDSQIKFNEHLRQLLIA